mmetsp:Transcript_21978/g.54291  ORF Transcript_21978/g.54291 Transcript_21978/m.54291 type:complete len:701 (+) Transcript_21978:50-2152(+)
MDDPPLIIRNNHDVRTPARVIALILLPTLALALKAISGAHEDHITYNNHHLRQTTTNDASYPVTPSFVVTRNLQEEAAATAETCTLDCCMQYEETICPSDNAWIEAIPFWLQICLIVLLLCFSALFSGLTLGLMSLDKTGLEIVMGGDDPISAGFAKKIFPVRENGNLLLCTLLLGNVAVNALLSIFLAAYTGGIIGFVSSTFLIVIFGEIVPQALCSRYALQIGARTVPLVKAIRVCLYIVAAPLAWVLDVALGRELASTYSNAEMLKLLQIHVQENVLDKETAGAMQGALTYKNMSVEDVMTPLERTFMLNVDDKLSFENISEVFKTGYSRIPVYEISRHNIIGLLFVKDLIFIDPEDEVPIRSFIQIFGRGVHVVWPNDNLGDVLAELKKGKSHLALVRDVNNEDETKDPVYEIRGIITLEDIIEKILGDTIVDETDAFMDSDQQVKVQRAEGFEWARLRLLDSKITDKRLSDSEVDAVTAHLQTNHAETFKLLTHEQLTALVARTPLSNFEEAHREVGQVLPTELLYEKNKPSDACTLILGGKVTILVGSENFRSDLSSWSVLGKAALENPAFAPDFTAYVSDGPCKCLCIKRSEFDSAVDASTVERLSLTEPRHSGRRLSATGSVNSEGLSSISEAGVSNHRKQTLAKMMKTGEDDDEDKPMHRQLSLRFAGVINSEDRQKTGNQENGGEKTFDA